MAGKDRNNKLTSKFSSEKYEAGVDEAGRGCLAGPVVAAAVILPDNFDHPVLNDSKQLTGKQRNELRPLIETCAIAWGIGICDHKVIDKINILNASFKAMNMALSKLDPKPGFILVDGNRFKPEYDIPFRCFVKGDSRFKSIAAASILAKTHRDEIMINLHQQYPAYFWKKNKGYPTLEHRRAIMENGISPYHRKSFRLLNNEIQLEIDF